MNRLDSREVSRRFKDTEVVPFGGRLGVIAITGSFALRDQRGCDGLGIMVLGRRIPLGFRTDQLQLAVNECLGLEWTYAIGFYDGFAGWKTVLHSMDQCSADEMAGYAIGQRDGAATWRLCDPVARARMTLRNAARLLQEKGWARGRAVGLGGRLSVDAVIRVAMWGHTQLDHHEAYQFQIAINMLETFLRERHNIEVLTLPWWNDHVCCNEAEAVAMLQRVGAEPQQ